MKQSAVPDAPVGKEQALTVRASRHMHRGVNLAVSAAVLFGLGTPFAKLLLGRTTPQLLAGMLYLGSGVGLLLVWSTRRGGAPNEAPLAHRDAPWLAGAIVSGGVLGPLLLMLGLIRTPASTASLLLNLEGVLTALLAWCVFRENVDRRIALGMVAIVAGVPCSRGKDAWR
jgi:drug/metabolite transporter (DMT)-like permease